jgi:hypothetical protein
MLGLLFDKNDAAAHELDLALKRAAARDAGIKQSAETAGDEWGEYAVEFIRTYLESHRTLHVDSLWDAGMTEPKSARGLGAAMQKTRTAGLMEPIVTPEGWIAAKPSKRSNMQLKAVWRSLIYRG